ncbi:MAG: hypothetical protein ACT4OJ_14840 [Bacteroidota bacterium]
MRGSFLLFLIMISGSAFAQFSKNKFGNSFDVKETYFSLNPFSVAEPQFAFGPSFGQRLTERSEYFIEAAYVGKTPFYKNDWQDYNMLRGARFIFQYRYHFLQQWRPLINFGEAFRSRRSRHHPFVGLEFRIKPISFSTTGSFVNAATRDTLQSYPFKANAFTYGGAVIFGNTFNLSSDGQWRLEFTAGIGAKQRNVNLKTVPDGYKTLVSQRLAFQAHSLYEEQGTVLVPLAVRLRYLFD